MASLDFYIKKHGKREGRKIYNAKKRAIRHRNRDKVNARQRARYHALVSAAKAA